MTDIHDIKPILPPNFLPLILIIVAIVVVLIFTAFILVRSRKTRNKFAPMDLSLKQKALHDLDLLRSQTVIAPPEELPVLTGMLHTIIRWYLGVKMNATFSSGTLRDILLLVPHSFSPILIFCYSMIYPFQKRSREDVLAFIDKSKSTIENDI